MALSKKQITGLGRHTPTMPRVRREYHVRCSRCKRIRNRKSVVSANPHEFGQRHYPGKRYLCLPHLRCDPNANGEVSSRFVLTPVPDWVQPFLKELNGTVEEFAREANLKPDALYKI